MVLYMDGRLYFDIEDFYLDIVVFKVKKKER